MAQPQTVMINTGDPVSNDDVQAQELIPVELSEELKFEESVDPNTFECCVCLLRIEGKVMGCAATCYNTLVCQTCATKCRNKCPTCRSLKCNERIKFIHRPDKEQEIKIYEKSRCKKHPMKGSKIYCVNCQVAACEYCMAENHVGHKRKKLSSESEQLAERI